MRSRGRRRAFVLLSTMLVVLVLGLLLRVAIIRMPSVLGAAGHSAARDQAERAAQSGIEFALTKLRETPDWKGGSGRQILLDHLGVLTVVQEQGNVLGTLTGSDGSRSEFRLRFNFQDGGGTGGDGRPDPSGEMAFAIPFVSVNNLLSDTEAIVPRGEGSNFAVLNPTVGFETPGQSVCLGVEGRALRSDGGVAARSTRESVYLMNKERAITDAVVMAGGGIDIKTGMGPSRVVMGGSMIKQATHELLRLRTKGGVNLHRSDGSEALLRLGEGTRGEINYNTAMTFKGNLPPNRVSLVEEDSGKDFYNLPWSSVKKASSSNSVKLPGGVYAYGDFGNGQREMYYFDMTYDDYKALPQVPNLGDPGFQGVNVGTDFSGVRGADGLGDLTSKLSIKPAPLLETAPGGEGVVAVQGFQLTVKDIDIRVDPSAGGNQSFALVPHSPTQWSSKYPETLPPRRDSYTPDSMKIVLSGTTISANDDVTIHGGISGKSGTITSAGTVQMLAGRTMVLETSGKTASEVEKEFEDANPPDDPLDGDGAEGPVADPEADANRANSSLQLNIYAREQLKISTFSNRVVDSNGVARSGYRNLTFKGLLYSWQDVEVVASDSPAHRATGVFTLRGSMVAYGADPESGEPGSVSSNPDDPTQLGGKVNIDARSSKLYWDPRFLPLKDLQGDSGSSFTLKRFSSSHPES